MKIQKIKEQSAAPAHCFEYVGSFSENKQKIIEETRQPHIRILDVWERESKPKQHAAYNFAFNFDE